MLLAAKALESAHITHGNINPESLMIADFNICNKSDVYIVEKLLGQGAYGLVAKCRKNATDQAVALKVMAKADAYSAIKELQAIKHLRKFDPDKINVMHCFDWFRNWSPLRVSEIRTIAKQMFVSLSALKELGLTHADIKIDNIMLVNHAATPFRVKLIDFGFCHLTSDLSEFDLFQAPGYRAPEVYLGYPPNEGVDMWGLACTLAELYISLNLFPGDSEYEIMKLILNLLGQPDNEMLNRGCRVRQYFTLDQTESGPSWRFKTLKEYEEDTTKKAAVIN
uniref:Protein kinase domain-containing protein n=1 Tax=Kryptolebias marmoratus TaxID=37003 RepID=A0A3Q3AH60_KRYMA